MHQGPTYNLETVKQKIGAGFYKITGTAKRTADEIGFNEEDIIHVIQHCLREWDFYKTMASEKMPGLMQDVYKTEYDGLRLYIKMQFGFGNNVVVISFKRE